MYPQSSEQTHLHNLQKQRNEEHEQTEYRCKKLHNEETEIT